MYLIIRIKDCKFLSVFDKSLWLAEFSSDFDNAKLFKKYSEAEAVAFYGVNLESKVLIVKLCDVL